MSDTTLVHWKYLVKSNLLEIGLHGYKHQDINGGGEFKNIPLMTQKKWIQAGKAYLDSVLNVKVNIFIPPWNKYDTNTVLALQSSGIKIISANMVGRGKSEEYNMTYLPANTESFYDLENSMRSKSVWFKNGTVIVLFHPYTIDETFDFERLDCLLGKISTDCSVETCTFQDLSDYNINMIQNINRPPVLSKFLNCVTIEKYKILLILDSAILGLIGGLLFFFSIKLTSRKTLWLSAFFTTFLFTFLLLYNGGWLRVLIIIISICILSCLISRVRISKKINIELFRN